MSHGSGLSRTAAALGAALLGCSSGGYVEGALPDLTAGRRDGAAVDAQTPTDGLMPPGDAAVMGDLASAPNTWTVFGQSFVGGTGICQQVDNGSGKTYFLTTSVANAPYHCQLAVDFPTKPTVDAVYKVSSANPPGPADTAYALTLDYRTGSYESWHSLDSGEIAVKLRGTSLWIEVRSALLHNEASGIPDQPVTGLIVCP